MNKKTKSIDDIPDYDLPALTALALGPGPVPRRRLAEAISGALGQWVYDFYCRKLSLNHEDPFYDDAVRALEKLQGRRLPRERVEMGVFRLDAFPRAPRARRRRWLKELFAALKACPPGKRPDAGLVSAWGFALRRRFEETGRSSDLDAALRHIRTTIDRWGPAAPWEIGWRLLNVLRPSLALRQRTADAREAFLARARHLHSAGRLDPFVVFEALLKQKGHRKEKQSWWTACLAWDKPPQGPVSEASSKRAHLLEEGHRLFPSIAALEKALALYRAALPGNTTHGLYALNKVGSALAAAHLKAGRLSDAVQVIRGVGRDVQFSLRHFPEDYTGLAHALDFARTASTGPLPVDEKKAWARRRWAWALRAERAGKGFYSSPYEHLMEGAAERGRVAEFERWALCLFLRHNTLAEKQLSPWARRPWVRRRARLRRLWEKFRRYHRTAASFYDGGVPWDELGKMSLPELRKRFEIAWALKGRNGPAPRPNTL